MDEKAWTMMGFLFGDAAEVAQRNATPEALRWCEAFEGWLEERGRTRSTLKQSKLAWRRLVQQCGKGPWELGREDIEEHLRWMEVQGYAAATRANTVGMVSNFYEFCAGKGLGEGNPAEGVRRPQVGRYVGQALLSREEVGRLLRALRRDKSALGRRDYAFVLARLRMGVALERLRSLRWREVREGELPGEVKGAIWEALEAGGRLETMGDEDYVFAPLREPGVAGVRKEHGIREYRAEDWATGKAVSIDALREGLKLYGRLAGIEEGKLTLMALRRTGMRLRVEDGASVKEMQGFLGSVEDARFTRYRLGKLPGLPEDGKRESASWEEGRVVERTASPFRPGEGVVHGMYMKSQPPEAVAAILAEKIEGLEEEVAGLRVLARGLVERQERARNRQEYMQLWGAYSMTTQRLKMVIQVEKALAEAGKEGLQWVADVEEMTAKLMELEVEVDGDAPLRRMDYKEEEEPEALEGLELGARRLAEEIAVSRYMLRNLFQRAMEVEETGEYVRMVELYGAGCVRLVKMLQAERGMGMRKVRRMQELLQQAIGDVAREMGLME